jgi:hypothetical protein
LRPIHNDMKSRRKIVCHVFHLAIFSAARE